MCKRPPQTTIADQALPVFPIGCPSSATLCGEGPPAGAEFLLRSTPSFAIQVVHACHWSTKNQASLVRPFHRPGLDIRRRRHRKAPLPQNQPRTIKFSLHWFARAFRRQALRLVVRSQPSKCRCTAIMSVPAVEEHQATGPESRCSKAVGVSVVRILRLYVLHVIPQEFVDFYHACGGLVGSSLFRVIALYS